MSQVFASEINPVTIIWLPAVSSEAIALLESLTERGFRRGRKKSYPKGIEEKQEFSRTGEGEVRDFTPRVGGEVAGVVGVGGGRRAKGL